MWLLTIWVDELAFVPVGRPGLLVASFVAAFLVLGCAVCGDGAVFTYGFLCFFVCAVVVCSYITENRYGMDLITTTNTEIHSQYCASVRSLAVLDARVFTARP